MPMHINILNIFLDDNERMKMAIGLMKFALKATTLCARPTKR
jgi:hypothetical protein